jgi:hypothetical protein
MKTKFLALLAATAVALMGCSLDQINFLPTAKIRAQISVLEFTGTYTASTGAISITNPAQTVTFQADRGSMAAVVTGVEARYEDQSGNSINATPTAQTLNQQVEAGKVTCDDKGVCASKPGVVSAPSSIALLSQQASLRFMQTGASSNTIPSGWRARITFFGRDSNGRSFQWEEVQAIKCNCTFN